MNNTLRFPRGDHGQRGQPHCVALKKGVILPGSDRKKLAQIICEGKFNFVP